MKLRNRENCKRETEIKSRKVREKGRKTIVLFFLGNLKEFIPQLLRFERGLDTDKQWEIQTYRERNWETEKHIRKHSQKDIDIYTNSFKILSYSMYAYRPACFCSQGGFVYDYRVVSSQRDKQRRFNERPVGGCPLPPSSHLLSSLGPRYCQGLTKDRSLLQSSYCVGLIKV